MPAIEVQPLNPLPTSVPARPRRFEFERETFAFANELLWEYRFDNRAGRTEFIRREPPPEYALRCFVLARAVRQFFGHAHFNPNSNDTMSEPEVARRVAKIIRRNPRAVCAPSERVVFPGFVGLRDFSRRHERLLKSLCGGAWQSYVLRSHWRMIFPISRAHQEKTAARLATEIAKGNQPIIHLVRFPDLTINHGMLLFGAETNSDFTRFEAYDPNDPAKAASLLFDPRARTFSLPPNRYWRGGPLNIIQIYRNWFF